MITFLYVHTSHRYLFYTNNNFVYCILIKEDMLQEVRDILLI